MSPRLLRHFTAPQPVILGRTLQPFSLWHQRTLAVFGIDGAADGLGDFADLFLAVRICAAEPFTPIPDLRIGWLERWAIKLDWAIFGERAEEEWDEFGEYIAHYHAGPHSDNAPGSRPIKSDSTLFLAVVMMQLGHTPREAWSTSPGLARFHRAAMSESQGHDPGIVSAQMLADIRAAGYDVPEDDF